MMRAYLIINLGAVLFMGACTDTLVYGERTGLNLAVRTDAPQGHPLEVNTGLQRRVVSYIPPRNQSDGEAVNMLSSFDLKRSQDSEGLGLGAKVSIETSFVSGKAAVSAGGNRETVQAIFDRPGVTASPNEIDQENGAKIRDWFIADATTVDAKTQEYLEFLKRLGGTFVNEGSNLSRAYSAVSDGKNAALNAQFIALNQL